MSRCLPSDKRGHPSPAVRERSGMRVRCLVSRRPDCTPLVTSKDNPDPSRRRYAVDRLQRQVNCLIQNIADCSLGRDQPPKHCESHDESIASMRYPSRSETLSALEPRGISLRKNCCHFRNLHLVHGRQLAQLPQSQAIKKKFLPISRLQFQQVVVISSAALQKHKLEA